MAKKGNLSKPHGDVPIKQNIIDSRAFKRVKNHGQFEGIFLYKEQIEQLLSNIPSNANGLWFVIGDILKNEELTQNSSKTVEILPAKYILESHEIDIPINSDIKGRLYSDFEDILGNVTDFILEKGPIMISKIPSQRTPPPKPKN